MSEFINRITPIDGMGGFYKKYEGQSLGRAIHYIYHICGLAIAEKVVFQGDGIITLGHDIPFATITWEGGYPFFKFMDEKFNDKQDRLLGRII